VAGGGRRKRLFTQHTKTKKKGKKGKKEKKWHEELESSWGSPPPGESRHCEKRGMAHPAIPALLKTPPMILLCSQGMEFVQRHVENVAPTSKYHLYGASALATAASSGSHLSPLASNFSLLYNSSSLVSVAYSALGPRNKNKTNAHQPESLQKL
jgi:hypothetical protein